MTDHLKPPDAARLLHELQHNNALRQEPVAAVALDPRLAWLHTWQSQRLA